MRAYCSDDNDNNSSSSSPPLPLHSRRVANSPASSQYDYGGLTGESPGLAQPRYEHLQTQYSPVTPEYCDNIANVQHPFDQSDYGDASIAIGTVHYRPAHHQSAVPPQFDAMGTNIAHTSAVAPPLPPLGDHGLAAFRPGGLSGIPAYQGSFTQVVNTGQPLMAVPGTPTASSQTSTRLGHPSPMSGAVPSATGTCQNSNALVIERYFNEMLNESPRHPNEPRIAHEPAEAMSIWGRTGQEQQVGGPRPPVSDTIAHVGEHPSLGPDRRQWQFVQHDGVSRPVASQPTHRRGPRDRDAYKKTRGVGACISCKIKRGSKKAGNCKVDDRTGDPCPPCIQYFESNAKRFCIRIPDERHREFLPFEKDVADTAPPPGVNGSQLERIAGEDLTVYFTSDPSSLTASPTLIFKLDGSVLSHLDTFMRDNNFVVRVNSGSTVVLDQEETRMLSDFEICACYLLAISRHAETEYRTDLRPVDISLAQQISHRVTQLYLRRYTGTFETLLERSISWMRARCKDGVQRNVAGWIMCGLSRLIEFQTTISMPPAMSSIAERLVTPAKRVLQDFKSLAELATTGMNNPPSVGFEEFTTGILSNLSAPDITIAHAFVPRVDSQTPTAIVGLRGNTNPFDKPGSLRVADLYAYSGHLDMESLQGLLNPGVSTQVVTPFARRNGPDPSAAQPSGPQPGNSSTATEPDLEFDYSYDPSSNLSLLPFNPTLGDKNEPIASVESFLTIASTPPATYYSNYQDSATSQLPYHSSNHICSFERDCSTSEEESGGEDEEGLRRASKTSGTDTGWETTTEETGSSC